jgi:D-3-phosphoglycerate dehydrogenase
VPTVIACLADYDAELVRQWAGRDDIEIRLADRSAGQDQVAELVAGASVVIGDPGRTFALDADAIAAMTEPRLIIQPSVGYDTVDVAAAADRGIPVANAAGYNADAVADWVLMAVLVLLRGGVQADTGMRAGRWDRMPLGRELGAMTVGIVGMGSVGGAVARRVQGFGSTVLCTRRSDRDVPGAARVPLAELLRRSDIVTVHLPLTETTRRMIGAAELGLMRDGSILVNSSRGPVVDQDALVDALRGGRPAAAALDVFDTEPLAADSPLRSLPQVYLSPHIAAGTEQARTRVRAMVAEHLRRALDGRPPRHVVNEPLGRVAAGS